MITGASRIFNVMQNAGTDTKSYLLTLTVSSINPIQLTDGDKLIIPENLCVFPSFIDITNISIGDKFLILTFNSGQIYYITDIISSNKEIIKYNQKIIELEQQINNLQSHV